MRETLIKTFEKNMNVRYSEVIPTFGKLLGFEIVDYERAFTDPCIKVLPMMTYDKDSEDRCSSTGSGFNDDPGFEGNEEIDASESSGSSELRSQEDMDGDSGLLNLEDDFILRRIKKIVNEKMVLKILDDLLDTIIEQEAEKRKRDIIDPIVDIVIEKIFESSTCPLFKLILDGTPYMLEDTSCRGSKELFFKTNLPTLRERIPQHSAIHGKLLVRCWNMVDNAMTTSIRSEKMYQILEKETEVAVLKKRKKYEALKKGKGKPFDLYINGKRIKLLIQPTKEEFTEVNLRTLQKYHPEFSKAHVKALERSWRRLEITPDAKFVTLQLSQSELGNDNQEPVAKKPKTSHHMDPNSNTTTTNNNVDPSQMKKEEDEVKTEVLRVKNQKVRSEAAEKSPEVSISPSNNMDLPRGKSLVKEGVIDLTKSDSGCCDDCRYVTSTHKTRMLSGKYKCRCHPCILRQQVMKIRRTDPYKVVKISEFKGPGDYWSQPWLMDLYEDVLRGNVVTPVKAIEMVGSREVINKAGKYLKMKQEKENAAQSSNK